MIKWKIPASGPGKVCHNYQGSLSVFLGAMVEDECPEVYPTCLFVDKPDEHKHMCKICMYIYNDPVVVCEEGHTFCRGCIEKTMERTRERGITSLCPVCRDEIEVLQKNRLMQETVMDMQVHCFTCIPALQAKADKAFKKDLEGSASSVVSSVTGGTLAGIKRNRRDMEGGDDDEDEDDGSDNNDTTKEEDGDEDEDEDEDDDKDDMEGQCTWVGTLEEAIQHWEECPKRVLVECEFSYLGCNERLIAEQMVEHEMTCGHELVPCSYYELGCYCHKSRKDLPAHCEEEKHKHELLVLEKMNEQTTTIDDLKEQLDTQTDLIDQQQALIKSQKRQIQALTTITEQLETDMNTDFAICRLHALTLGATPYFIFKFRGYKIGLNLCFELHRSAGGYVCFSMYTLDCPSKLPDCCTVVVTLVSQDTNVAADVVNTFTARVSPNNPKWLADRPLIRTGLVDQYGLTGAGRSAYVGSNGAIDLHVAVTLSD